MLTPNESGSLHLGRGDSKEATAGANAASRLRVPGAKAWRARFARLGGTWTTAVTYPGPAGMGPFTRAGTAGAGGRGDVLVRM
jgi:hypothetical protein